MFPALAIFIYLKPMFDGGSTTSAAGIFRPKSSIHKDVGVGTGPVCLCCKPSIFVECIDKYVLCILSFFFRLLKPQRNHFGPEGLSRTIIHVLVAGPVGSGFACLVLV